MNPKRALTREPGGNFTECLSCHPLRHTVNIEKAKEQHGKYRAALRDLGLEVLELPPDDSRPDACFVEDNAVVRGRRALVCRMGAESRRGEEAAVESALAALGIETRRAVDPANVEGGDVVHLEKRLISGVSQRTNREGVRQLAAWLGVRVDTIEDLGMMHLKSHLTCIGINTVIVNAKYASLPVLEGLEKIVVPKGEEYAADALAVDGSVILPRGMPKTVSLLRNAGFSPVPIDVSEFEKCDGAVTCLSILL